MSRIVIGARGLKEAGPSFLPYARQHIDEDDLAAVAEALCGDYLTTGPAVEKFEAEFAEAVGAKEAVVCASGTAALHLATMALDLGPGDQVVVPSVTFLATANVVRHVGAEVVFSDIDPETGMMRPDDLLAALSRSGSGKIKAILPVCYAGQSPDREAISAAASGLHIVYDSCHALATTCGDNGRVGDCRQADMETFSFHAIKTITTGEGGAVTTNDNNLAARLRNLRNHGMTRTHEEFENTDFAFDRSGEANPWYYEMAEPGYNYRLTDFQCALGSSQLRKLDVFAAARRQLAKDYIKALASLDPIVRSLGRQSGCDPVWHLFAVRIDFAAIGISRAHVMTQLKKAGFGTQVHYLPVHLQPYYRRRYDDLSLPGAEAFYAQTLSLPFHVGMGEADVVRVVEALAGALEIKG